MFDPVHDAIEYCLVQYYAEISCLDYSNFIMSWIYGGIHTQYTQKNICNLIFDNKGEMNFASKSELRLESKAQSLV
jgi:hypothetical protein